MARHAGAKSLAGGAELLKGERDRALAELKVLREDNTRLTAELAATQAQKAERSESEEAILRLPKPSKPRRQIS